jgi:hypothetical protein
MNPEETLIVSGFGRCGTTMVMQMLNAAGVRVHCDSYASFEATEMATPRQGMYWARLAGI